MAQPNCIVEQLVGKEGREGEEVTIRGSALREFAQRVASQNWQREEEVKVLREEVERLKHLLAIREEMMGSVEAERKRLEKELREAREGKSSEGKRGKKLDDLSAIELDSFAEESFVAAQPLESRQLTDTRKKICLKKAKRPTPTRTPQQQDLNLAKTQLQVAKLRAQLSQIQFNFQILLIENEHLSQECRLTERRERTQQQSICELLRQSNKENVSGNGKSSGKKYRLNSCFEEEGLLRGDMEHAKMVPPPITPHFSNFTSMFSKKAQMIELQPCLSEQSQTEGSEGYRI